MNLVVMWRFVIGLHWMSAVGLQELQEQFQIAAHFVGDIEADEQTHGACYPHIA